VKEFLSRAGYSFLNRNIDEDAAAYSELIALGFRTVPVTLVNGRSIKGYDEEALSSALDEAGGS
jgi:hypothetical protein